jgi:bifunctional DNA-binding transcriptional regulator/antitoxin component of YhaV-PrlF toxin-antitoxin module
MPLDQRVTFKNLVEKCGKVQVPKIIRWQFKMEPGQILKVALSGRGSHEPFYAKMDKDGRIYIPKTILFAAFGKVENLAGTLVEITIQPA